MKPAYPEWVYPTVGVFVMFLFLSFATAMVVDGKDKPARPLDRITPDRT